MDLAQTTLPEANFMSAGRRGVLLSLIFLGAALSLCPAQRATAQPGRNQPNDPGAGRHKLWRQELSPEEIRAILARFGQDDGKGDPLEELMQKLLKQQNPDVNDERLREAAKRFLNDKEFRDRVIDLAQKQQNLMRDKNVKPPNLPPEDIAKLRDLLRDRFKAGDGGKGDPFRLPKEQDPPFDPNALPPFDPRNPQFDPMQWKGVDPNRPPPKIDKDTGFPLHPDTGKPFDPRNGDPIDPKNPPKIDPPPRKFDPPKFDPRKLDPPPGDDGKRKFDPENPLGKPNESPDKASKSKAVEAMTALWEKNVGPIDDSPAVKRAIAELVGDTDLMEMFKDAKGRSLLDALEGDNDDKLGGLLGNDGGGDKWEWPKFDFWNRGRDLDVDVGSGRSRSTDFGSRDSSSRSSSGGGLGTLDLGGLKVPFLFLLLLAALIAGALVWWKWGSVLGARPLAAGAAGPAPWPIDPRAINSREDVVKAFEYLSVMICGPAAKMWTHSTIADELTELARTHGEVAVKLARLYELARYAPLDEPLTRAELMEARRLVCDLAGIDEA
jgi:hypothetical protein